MRGRENEPTALRVSDEAADALATGRGLVALESTLIAQGLPWPENLETATAAEAAVRAAGAVPATIAVLDGVPTVGLTAQEIERLARSVTGPSGPSFVKASRRDLSAAVAAGRNAATTVSATLFLARRAGIGLMATGGLGGVHRDASRTFDVSNDLDELARADGCLVVCSGVKSILDTAATLEVLETKGVTVVGYRTDDFPAFTTRESGLPVEARVETPDQAADLLRAHRALGLPGAVVLAQPVDGAVALDRETMETGLAEALREADRQGITGKAVTPFLLGRLHRLTGGLSLKANTALIIANAGLAGAVAAATAPGQGPTRT